MNIVHSITYYVIALAKAQPPIACVRVHHANHYTTKTHKQFNFILAHIKLKTFSDSIINSHKPFTRMLYIDLSIICVRVSCTIMTMTMTMTMTTLLLDINTGYKLEYTYKKMSCI